MQSSTYIKPINIIGLNEFLEEYATNLREPNCLPESFEELCGGWTQDTFRQVFLRCTKKGKAPLKPYFESPEDMEILSNKRNSLGILFKIFDFAGNGRIDTYDLFAVILLAVQGQLPVKLSHTIGVFGFNSQFEITVDECLFYFDCLFKGLMKLLIKKGDRLPRKKIRRLNSDDLHDIVASIFPEGKDVLERDDFIEEVMHNDLLKPFFQLFSEKLEFSVIKSRERALERIHISQFIRKFIMDLMKNVNKVITEIEEGK